MLIKKLDEVYSKIRANFNKRDQASLVKRILALDVNKNANYKTNLCIISITLDKGKCKCVIANRKDLPRDTRIESIIRLFDQFTKWYGKQNIQLTAHTSIYIWLSDRYIWEIPDIDQRLPICLYACPKNMNYIIIPDSTFISQSDTKRYASNGLDWDQQKKLFTKDVHKQDIMFFRGADTTSYNHNLRSIFYNRIKTEPDVKFKHAMKYEMLTPKNYQSIKEIKKYKWLLNLPGRYPWSTRLKYLYLSKSYVINVNVKTVIQDDDVNLVEPNYISFVDLIVPPKYGFNINMTYIYSSKNDENDELNLAAVNNVYDKIKQIYHKTEKSDPTKDPNVLKANRLINNFTTDNIYEYYYAIILRNIGLGI